MVLKPTRPGLQVLNGGDLFNALEQYAIGDRVTLTVLRTTDQVGATAWAFAGPYLQLRRDSQNEIDTCPR